MEALKALKLWLSSCRSGGGIEGEYAFRDSIVLLS